MVNSPNSSELKLSVVIPIRAMVDKLKNLESTLIVLQNLPIQVILVHDDAGDGTGEALQILLGKVQNSNVSLQTTEVGSPGLARNLGLKNVISDWICFWDCDDLPVPTAYLTLLKETQNRGALVGIGQISSFDSENKLKKMHTLDYSDVDFINQLANMPAFTRMIFHESVVQGKSFMNFRSGEDQCFLRDLNFLNFPIHVSNECVYLYFTAQDGQLTQNKVALLDAHESLRYLVNSFPNTVGMMRKFAFAQITKLSLTALRDLIKRRKLFLARRGLFKATAVFLWHPLAFLKLAFFFKQRRIKLAGRENL